ncbi:unnamed protein product [Effrenium voratum]|nr:unnamed protein product [Effrenium voratum]
MRLPGMLAASRLRSRLPRQLQTLSRGESACVATHQVAWRSWRPAACPGRLHVRCCTTGLSSEERIARLETEVQSLKKKLDEVEQVATKAAKRKGIIAFVKEAGAPFALWYVVCWSGSFLALYLMLEWEVISWQQSLRPLFEKMGMDQYFENIDPTAGNIALAFAVNELLEAVRFPFVIATSGPIIRLAARLRPVKAAAGP